ncbi:MAG: DMT family transporter [Burkholderiales bacterium]|nr:DMT family transporter [Burkholderiales bacterium]
MTPPAAERDPKRERLVGYLAAAAIVVIWSGFIVVSRAGARGNLGPFDLVALRVGVSGLVLLPVYLSRRLWKAPARQAFALMLTAGIGYGVFAYSGFAFAPAAHGAVLLPGALPFSTALLAVLVLRDRLSRGRIGALALILVGIVLVGWNGFAGDVAGAWRGDILFLCASTTWALYTVFVRKWRWTAIDATATIAVLAACAYLPVYLLWLPSKLATAPVGEIVFQGVYQGLLAVAIAGIAYTRAVEVLGPLTTTSITAIVPATAALAAWPMLGEPLSALALGGVLLVTLGMLAGVRASR